MTPSLNGRMSVSVNYIKQALTSDPLLKPFDTNKEITIFTDASSKGDDNSSYIVAYGGQALIDHKKNIQPQSSS